MVDDNPMSTLKTKFKFILSNDYLTLEQLILVG